MNSSVEHFNKFAKKYDYYKIKNWYYYDGLKKIYQDLIPSGKKVLDIGCGTGDILVNVEPKYGLGIDASQEMIKISRSKYKDKKNIEFLTGTTEELIGRLNVQSFDYIFLADVIEHLNNIPLTIKSIGQIAKSDTKLIISMANPFWEPALLISEKLGLKMAEGPHKRIALKELELILAKNYFKIIEKDYRLILPIFIPFLSNFINRYFYQIPLLRNLGLVIFIKCSKII